MPIRPDNALWPGAPLAILSAILFGVSTPLSKVLLGRVDPQLLAGLLYLGAGIGLAAMHGAATYFPETGGSVTLTAIFIRRVTT